MMRAFPLERAIAVAAEAHAGQTDKGDAPYILHPLRVMLAMPDDEHRIVAVLHDVVEDTDWTLSRLRAEGFSEDVIFALDRLTKSRGESYGNFIARVSSSSIATRVKIADLQDNMDMDRIPRERRTDADADRYRKYFDAFQFLRGQLRNYEDAGL